MTKRIVGCMKVWQESSTKVKKAFMDTAFIKTDLLLQNGQAVDKF